MIMKIARHILIIEIVVIILYSLSGFGEIGYANDDGITKRTKNSMLGCRNVSVDFLKTGYNLEIRSEGSPRDLNIVSIPYETTTRLFILKGDELGKMVSSLGDLEGFVKIDTQEKALEFVRLMTDLKTYYTFRPRIMVEVFKGSVLNQDRRFGEASPEFLKKYNITPAEVINKNGFFVIERYVVEFLWPGHKEYPSEAKLSKLSERVFENGEYTVNKKMILDSVDYSEISYPLIPR